jgi:dihydrofolate reductase
VIESPVWTFEYASDPMYAAVGELTDASEAILLGRKTFEMFAPAWRDRTVDDDPGAPFFNETKKHIVTRSPLTEEWNNAEQLGPYDPKQIAELKESTDGDVFISGSGMLIRGLLADGLLDELHLFVFPLTLGSGDRLFPEGETPETKLRLVKSEIWDTGVAHLAYGPA